MTRTRTATATAEERERAALMGATIRQGFGYYVRCGCEDCRTLRAAGAPPYCVVCDATDSTRRTGTAAGYCDAHAWMPLEARDERARDLYAARVAIGYCG